MSEPQEEPKEELTEEQKVHEAEHFDLQKKLVALMLEVKEKGILDTECAYTEVVGLVAHAAVRSGATVNQFLGFCAEVFESAQECIASGEHNHVDPH